MSSKYQVGDTATRTKAFSAEEVKLFSEISTDTNPIHLDESVAAESIFKQRVVHGMLVGSLFSGIIGCELPGTGTIYLNQSLNFKAPVPLDEPITATVEITNVREKRNIVTLKTVATDSQGKVVIEGEAVVLAP